MKNVIFFAFIALVFASCHGNKNTEYITIDKGDKPSKTIEITEPQPRIPVGEANFYKLVSFIERNGVVVNEKSAPNGSHQYVFFDSKGTRHAFLTVRCHKGDTTVTGISVWAYYNGVKKQENFFGYDITKERAFPFLVEDEYVEKHIAAVKLGYDEFLAMVNKKS